MYYDVEIHWKYKGRSGICTDTFGFPSFTREKALEDIENDDYFWYEEGNGSCDCNRSRMIGVIEEFPCGNEIEFTSIKGLVDSIRDIEK